MTDAADAGNAPRLARLDQLLGRLESFTALISGLVIFALMLLAVAQILGRKLFNAPVPGFIDLVEQSMAVFAFLGIAYCQRLGGHIRMDILLMRFRGRAVWISELIGVLLMLLVTTALIYGSWLHFERALNLGDSTIDINLPTWPAKLMVPLSLSLLWLRLTLQLAGYIRLIRQPGATPIAVPLLEDVSTQAQHEVDGALGENAQ